MVKQPTRKDLVLEDDISIPQPGSPTAAKSLLGEAKPERVGPTDDENLHAFHLDSLLNFVNPRGFGWVKSRAEVAGFQAHHFRSVPKSERWRVESIELVGLLLHQKPVVYVTASLPRMEELRAASTRALDAFEAVGLAELKKGEGLFVSESKAGLRLLGSIRATEHCTACHGGDGGELLGAFSYALTRAPAKRE
jgi:hypothetical protein